MSQHASFRHASVLLMLSLLASGCLATVDLDGDFDASMQTPGLDAALDMAADISADDGEIPVDMPDDRPDLPPNPPDDGTPPDASDMEDAPDTPQDMPDLPPEEPYVIISELTEGAGDNKFVEIYNPTDAPFSLMNIYLASFNEDKDGEPNIIDDYPSSILHLGKTIDVIEGKEALILCHKQADEPLPQGKVCAVQERLGVNFNGDDPVALYRKTTNENMIGPNDLLLDIFGQPGVARVGPPKPWEAKTYTRCDLTPYAVTNAPFDPTDRYIESSTTYEGLGTPPPDGVSCPAL